MATRMLSAVLGLAIVGLAFPAAGYLANGAWTIGTPGFWLLVAVPGLALLARAARRDPSPLVSLLPLAVMLLGLEVTDSARPEVVAGGYWVAGLAAVATVVSAVVLRRRRDQPRVLSRSA